MTKKHQRDTPDRSERIRAYRLIRYKKIRDKVLISVKDNGKWIPKINLVKIFQPFFTTKPTGEGTGLDLSLSYDIITKSYGGELKVETKDGELT